ncbi:hypothetical protein [Kosmotoga pacifica]|uniref:Uncharacterized protein n=1 Tax=Kosmotoga pacifica TaxID=1330330 RepID=A0A0G2Z4U3_9BACT|nr:hypothetical protein [Kosmotoga pacifica]AKI96572.1 hypothetical protein IX53_00635 [Kosmotoga pacifica]
MVQLRLFNEEEKLRQLQERYCHLDALFWKTRDRNIRKELEKVRMELTGQLLKMGYEVDHEARKMYLEYLRENQKLIQATRDFCMDVGMWSQEDEERYQKVRRALNAVSKSRSVNGTYRP